MNKYKASVITLAIVYVSFPLALSCFNYVADPHNRYHFSISSQDLQVLSKSDQLVLKLPNNYNDRILLKRYIKIKEKPRVVALGGSRVMALTGSFLPDQHEDEFLNCGVTNGTISDYISIWQLLKSENKIPEILVFSMDVQSLKHDSRDKLWLPISEYYIKFGEETKLPVWFLSWMQQQRDLLSYQTTKMSIIKLIKRDSADSVLLERKDYNGDYFARTSSFSLLYPGIYEHPHFDTVSQQGEKAGMGEILDLENWNISRDYAFDKLDKLLKDMASLNVKIILVAMPYHPKAYDIIHANEKAFLHLQDYVKKTGNIATKYGVYFLNAATRFAVEFSNEDFMDGVHLNAHALDSLMAQSLSDGGVEV